MEQGKVAIRIDECPEKDGLCGHIVWLKKAVDDRGKPRVDHHNPVKSLRKRPLCGLTVLKSFQKNGEEMWEGRVYNPKDGNSYSGDLQVLAEDKLRVRAYLGIPLFGKVETWSKLGERHTERCS